MPKAHALRSFLPTTGAQMDHALIANGAGGTYHLARAQTASLVSCCLVSRHEPAS